MSTPGNITQAEAAFDFTVWFKNTFGIKLDKLLDSLGDTVYMLGWGLVIGAAVGFLLALVLVMCRKGGLWQNRVVYGIVNVYVNIVRSMPFIITLVFVFPLTRLIVGKTYGSTAMLVPLVIYISPYMARLIENSLLEVSPGVIEAALAMGATTWQIITRFLLPEALSSIALAMTTGTVGLLGATAMAGYVGGGGVGDLALTYGYQRYNFPLLILTIVILVIFVQLLQLIGNRVSGKLREHR